MCDNDAVGVLYAKTRSWRKVGDLLGVSGAYARQLATGERRVTPRVAKAVHRATTPRAHRVTVALPDDVAAQLDAARLPGETRVATIKRLTRGTP